MVWPPLGRRPPAMRMSLVTAAAQGALGPALPALTTWIAEQAPHRMHKTTKEASTSAQAHKACPSRAALRTLREIAAFSPLQGVPSTLLPSE